MPRALWIGIALVGPTIPTMAGDLPLLFQSDFAGKATAGWTMADPAAWKIVDGDGGKVLELFRQSNYQPKVRSPFNYALIDDLVVTDFSLDARAQSTIRDYAHRDMVLVFGFQDPEHFYYIHFGKAADSYAHSIFLVNGAPRVSIAKERTKGTPWTDDWHHLRLTRNVGSGEILVYFDDMKTPIMKTVDKTYAWGKVGVGSFDDTGRFSSVKVHGVRHDAAKP